MGDIDEQDTELANRLKEARFAQNLTMRQLAERTDPRISHATIHLYESGKVIPNHEALNNLAKALDVSIDNLRGNNVLIGETTMLWRKKTDRNGMAVVPEDDLRKYESLLAESLDQYLEMERLLEKRLLEDPPEDQLNDLRIPKFDRIPYSDKLESLEIKAKEIRRRLHEPSKPIHSVSRVLEDNNVKIIPIDAPEVIHNLFCYIQRNNHPFKNSIEAIALSRKFFTVRSLFKRRYILACKLAHRMLDSGVGLVLGHGSGYLGTGTREQRENQKEFEEFVEYLAQAFLMPREPLAEVIAGMKLEAEGVFDVSDIMYLRDLYGVPIRIVLERLYYANHISGMAKIELLGNKAWDIETDFYEGDSSIGDNQAFVDMPVRLHTLLIYARRKKVVDEKLMKEMMDSSLLN